MKTSETSISEEKIAIHEAGHAILYNHFGIKFEKITIVPKEGKYHGTVVPLPSIGSLSAEDIIAGNIKVGDMKDEDRDEYKRRVVANPMIDFGGLVAQLIYEGATCEDFYSILDDGDYRNYGSSGDLDRILFQLREAIGVPHDDEDIFILYYPRVCKILVEKWPAVLALAKALLDKKEMDGSEADQIIEANL